MDASRTPGARRAQVLRDALSFQFKLVLDALRDLVLSPWSLGAAAIDLLRARSHEPEHFYAAIRAGRRTEDWIDLWSAARTGETGSADERAVVDALIGRLEIAVRQPQGGAEQIAELRAWIEQRLAALRQPPGPPEPPSGTPQA